MVKFYFRDDSLKESRAVGCCAKIKLLGACTARNADLSATRNRNEAGRGLCNIAVPRRAGVRNKKMNERTVTSTKVTRPLIIFLSGDKAPLSEEIFTFPPNRRGPAKFHYRDDFQTSYFAKRQ